MEALEEADFLDLRAEPAGSGPELALVPDLGEQELIGEDHGAHDLVREQDVVIDLIEHSIEHSDGTLELSVVMPCLNEAETLGICIEKASRAILELGIEAEIIIADNGSTDGSQAIACELGARVVDVDQKGYGSALMGGIAAARGRYIIMGDADDSYDFTDLSPFLEKLREGNELVMGNRFKGEFVEGAMPALHRYFGTPALTGIQRLLFRNPIGDVNCGMRGFRKDSVRRLGLRAPGMEFASEMIVKASLNGLKIAEVPTTLSPDGRSRPPHLKPWSDGWRHLRFLLLHSPTWLFLVPGAALIVAALGVMLKVLPQESVPGSGFTVPAMVLAGVLALVGYQSMIFAYLAKTFAAAEGIMPATERIKRMSKHVDLELGLKIGLAMLVGGLGGVAWGFMRYGAGPLMSESIRQIVLPSLTVLAFGVQTLFAAFFLAVLGLRHQ
jgi:glycosyltransferase involved in cell wall biosynthesis